MMRLWTRQTTASAIAVSTWGALAAVAALAGCSTETRISGNIPEKTTRELGPKPKVTVDRGAAYKKREEEAAARGDRLESPEAGKARIGVASTHLFHRPGCELLKAVPAAEQVQFASGWNAIDEHYSPCDKCRSGP